MTSPFQKFSTAAILVASVVSSIASRTSDVLPALNNPPHNPPDKQIIVDIVSKIVNSHESVPPAERIAAVEDDGTSSSAVAARAADPLPSWNDTPAKQAIVDFVSRVTSADSPDFVPPEDRIAAFDNDGTLWAEKPFYFQFFFALDRVKQLAPEHPEWKDTEPFASLLEGDPKAALAGGRKSLLEIVTATHAGMTTDRFEQIVTDWIATARHPQTGRRFTNMVYQPMLELLAYLRANDFKTFIVSGGGIEFMRPWAPRAYGIPPAQVVGSSIKTRYEVRDGTPVLIRLPEMNFIDDQAGKPVGINSHIGQRPLATFGNSDGDFQMLEWTTAGDGPRFGMLVHHTDAKREYAYNQGAEQALKAAPERGWTVVDMQHDWKVIYPPETN